MSFTPTAPRRDARKLWLHTASDVAVLVLLFGAMFSAPAILIVAGAALVGLVLYACFSRDARRGRTVVVALGAMLAAGVISLVVARLR